jgi:uncharacterized protein (TIGR03083 family)
MSMDRETLLAAARAEREALGRTIQKADPGSWDNASARSGWNNRDVLAHLAAFDGVTAAVLAGEEPDEVAEYRDTVSGEFTMDGFGLWTLARRAQDPYRELATEWGLAADAVLTHAAKIPEDEWDTLMAAWPSGELPARDLVQLRIAEWWLHGEDIRTGAELDPRLEHRPIAALNDLAIRRVPRALAGTGNDYWGMSARFTLGGPGGGVWDVRLAPGPEPDPSKTPDVSFDGNAHAFALICVRRFSADAFIENGDLVLGGNDEIGYDILERISLPA